MLIVPGDMGFADRDYQRQGPMRPPGRLAGAPVTKWLLISNLVIFVIDLMLRPAPPAGSPSWYYEASPLGNIGEFSIDTAIMGGQVWRFVSFQFLHGSLMHVLFNMWGIYMFGPLLEQWFRSKPFAVFYLLTGIAGALFYSLLVAMPVFLPDGMVGQRLVGASAGVFGILVGVAVIAPAGEVRLLFPPIAMRMRTFALVFLGIEVFIVLTNGGNAGGSAGHLGGALAGFFFLKIGPVRKWLAGLGSGVKRVPRKAVRQRRRFESKLRPSSAVVDDDPSEVDRILDKINQEGLQSLTDEEREVLKRSAGN